MVTGKPVCRRRSRRIRQGRQGETISTLENDERGGKTVSSRFVASFS
jgi:hypothetical protein